MERLGDDEIEALEGLLCAAAKLARRQQAAADEMHTGRLSGVARGILSDLDRQGAQTVPQMARARDCSRQHVQTAVNSLAEAGYVEFVSNPAHRRSHLVQLTDRGRGCSAEMQRRERRILSGLPLEAEAEELRQASRVLETVLQALTLPPPEM